MTQPFPKQKVVEALLSSLPENEPSLSHQTKEVAFTYVPPSHARALDPDNALVEGIRGAGKTFWWESLNSDRHREFVASAFPEARIGHNLVVSQGFGTNLSPNLYPGKDILNVLRQSFEPRHIWRSIVATHLEYPSPFPLRKNWIDKVKWVSENPEIFDKLLYQIDGSLSKERKVRLILFDALDRLADDWKQIRPLARALLQVALEMRSMKNIRLKLFVRPDMIEDRGILDFPDSSKLLSRKVSLSWQRADLYALVFQCMGNAPTGGANFRNQCKNEFRLSWRQDMASKAWILPSSLRTDGEVQKQIFHAIAGPAMASGPSGHKRGLPYTWLPNHLVDGRDQVSPRSFCAALRKAAETESDDKSWKYPLHFKAIQTGVQSASGIRTDEVREDYPWINLLMSPLRGNLTVPCEVDEIFYLWREAGTIATLNSLIGQADKVKLPPQHIEEGPEGIITDLQGMGLMQRLNDGRIQIPDVYRIAFGLGRRGGVKPLK